MGKRSEKRLLKTELSSINGHVTNPMDYTKKASCSCISDTFNLAQERLSRNPRRPSKTITNPLAGVIKCGMCGRSMYRRPYQKRGQSASLICSEKTCHNVSSAFYLVEDALLTAIKEWIDGYEIKKKQTSMTLLFWNPRQNSWKNSKSN